MELALDLADGDDGFGLFGLGGGLQRRRRVVQAILAGDGDDSGLLSSARRPTGDSIAYTNGKHGYGLNVGARALGNASTAVK